MFAGHFAAALAAKSVAPRTSLGTLTFAAQWIDLLWPTLLLAGFERVRIEPGATATNPLVFEHYPWSHSLAAVCAWALVIGTLHFTTRRDARAAVVIGSLVVSHWLLDVVVHVPDLPVVPGGRRSAPDYGISARRHSCSNSACSRAAPRSTFARPPHGTASVAGGWQPSSRFSS